MSSVTVIDAGVGNLGNLERAILQLGARCSVSTDADSVSAARCLVLPGVGAFRPPRERLRGALEEAIGSALENGAWLLGICVGYQLLFEGSDEFGSTDGLALLAGRVTELEPSEEVLVPHIGWNSVEQTREHRLFDGIPERSYFYFVHSFAPHQVSADQSLATTLHGARFASVAALERVMGVQFHPEKSGNQGLRLLRNFIEMATS